MKVYLLASAAVILMFVIGLICLPMTRHGIADEKDFPKLSNEEVKAAADESVDSNETKESKQESAKTDESTKKQSIATKGEEQGATKLEKATFGNGCFWCTEAVFQRLKGVESVRSGYIGGLVDNPTYKQVCTGSTGHAEALEISYDPEVISFDELLEVFWRTHDPTTLNRQGNDIGTQYRSAIFYHSEEQKKLSELYKAKLDEAKAFKDPIVTEITEASVFYPAEDYHQNYFNLNANQPYCRAVVAPKVEKLHKVFADKLKEEK